MSEPKYYRFSLENGLEGTAEFVPATTSYAIAFDLDLRHRLEGNYMDPALRFNREARDVDDSEYMHRILRNGGIRYSEKWTLKEMAIPLAAPGNYHPRIWRQSSGPSSRELYGNSFLGNLVAYWNLERDLQSILRTIEPDPANDLSYGHSLRDILILACTEVEQLLKQVLRANGYAPSGGRWSTNDYVKTISVLRLRDWAISFSDFPDYPPLSPFKYWNGAQPTVSLYGMIATMQQSMIVTARSRKPT